MRCCGILLTVFVMALCLPAVGQRRAAAADGPPTAADVAFFETRIRPVLVAHCLECHSAKADEPGGGLLLDRAAGWQAGGDSGPAIVPGDSATSLVMAALRYESLEMPPSGRLPQAVIDDFQRWIDRGAADPRDDPMPAGVARAADGGIDWEAARTFWSFQPPRHAPPPAVADAAWGRDAVDAFVLARLEAAGLRPSGDAAPLVRLRRLAYDLTGLPPEPDLLDAFVADPSPAHWERIVDRLLASQAAAEHQARRWLDVARYADSNGSDFNATFHDAWRYRDFVIRAFAADMPFDQFVVRQIAGDLLEPSDQREADENLVATGFLMLGTKMLSERDKAKLEMDVVDDMIDTCGRAFLGLTLGCARCHDHKFDPVPTEDYYALAGIFRSTQVLDGESQKYVSTWVKRPLPVEPEHAAAVAAFEARRKALAGDLAAARKHRDGEKAAADSAGAVVFDDQQATREGPWQASTYTRPFHGAGYFHDGNRAKGECRITFPGPPRPGTYRVRIAYSPAANRATNVPVTVVLGPGVRHDRVVDQRAKPAIAPFWHELGEFRCDDPATTSVVIGNAGTDGYVLADAVSYEAVGTPAPPPAAADADGDDARRARLAAAEAEVKRIEGEIAALDAARPPPLPMAMAVRESQRIGNAFVCVRGEVDNPGPEVPRGFLRICSSEPAPQLPADRSGRLELARWLTDPDNPLAARVIVNRVWMQLFGEGIVRSVDNFGMQGERPTHPELLDTLAIDFVRDGWSLRRLIRRLVLTRTYGQASTPPAVSPADRDPAVVDPENRLLWRAHRKRVPAEALRDTLLVAAGLLDPSPSVAPMAAFGTLVTQNVATPGDVKVSGSSRRSIYLPVIRGMVHPLLVTFDAADPDMLVGRREQTNVPAQPLALVNNPEVIGWCERIAARVTDAAADDTARVRLAFRLLLERDPDPEETAWVTAYVGTGGDAAARWSRAVQAIVASTEFRFLD